METYILVSAPDNSSHWIVRVLHWGRARALLNGCRFIMEEKVGLTGKRRTRVWNETIAPDGEYGSLCILQYTYVDSTV